jgi:hypothetical protein
MSEAKPMIGKGKHPETQKQENNSSAQHRCGVAKISSRPMRKEMSCAATIGPLHTFSLDPLFCTAHTQFMLVLVFESTA